MNTLSRVGWRAFVLIGLLVLANIWVWALVASVPPLLTVTLLDVGQGDAIVVQSPGGRVLVVDTGPISQADDMGRRVVLPFLRSQGIGRIDALLLTHPHDDHVGGAASLLERIPVARILVPTTDSSEAVYRHVLAAAEGRRVPVVILERGQALDFGDGLRAEVLNPSRNSASSPNNGSLSIRLRFGNAAIVLTGDAESDAEAEMADSCDLGADVLKLGHHGSRTSTTERFLDSVRPQAAIVSVGARNIFGHPNPAVMSRLSGRRIPVFRTDRDGAITVVSDGKRVAVRRTRTAAAIEPLNSLQ